MAQTMGSEIKAGTAATIRKPLNDNDRPSAAIMFCGLPISVPDEPVLAAKQNASRNGAGLSPRASVIETRSGVIATTTTSFVSIADKNPPTAIKMASKAGGDTLSAVTRCATQP